MSPLKSTIGKTVGKLLSVGRNRDLSLNSSVRTNRTLPLEASGGNIADGVEPGNGYKYHVFTAPGTLTVSQAGAGELLLIGGGGSGGAFGPPNGAGGGGAGGIVHHTGIIIAGPVSITVGNGGGPVGLSAKDNGDDSTFVMPDGTITALGGGAGGYYGTAGNPGGSGGGGGGYGDSYSKVVATATQPGANPSFTSQTGFNQYGNNGGAPTDNNPGNAGGGGGAGGKGGNSPAAGDDAAAASAGGPGRAFPAYAAPLPAFAPMPAAWKSAVGPTGLYGGGGAGENPYSGTPTALGGPGGGGSGPSPNGIDYTGGGGAGTNATGGVGGDGICIIRYLA